MSRRRFSAAAAATVALLAVDLVAFSSGAEHHGGFWNDVPLGDLVLGALGAGVLIAISVRLLKPLLARPEDHYRKRGEP